MQWSSTTLPLRSTSLPTKKIRLKVLDTSYAEEDYAIGMAKGSALEDAVNKALEELKADGTLQASWTSTSTQTKLCTPYDPRTRGGAPRRGTSFFGKKWLQFIDKQKVRM